MDANRFDAIAKELIRSTSRRRAVGVFLGGALGLTALLGHEEAEAKSCQKACEKKKDCKKKNDKKARKKCKDQCEKSCKNQVDFCAGKNSCEDGHAITTCQRSGAAQCVCVAIAATGAPFCALNNSGTGVDCLTTPCPAGQTCIDFTGGACAGGTRCAEPCPAPI